MVTWWRKKWLNLLEKRTHSPALLERPGLYVLLWAQDTHQKWYYTSVVKVTEFQAWNVTYLAVINFPVL